MTMKLAQIKTILNQIAPESLQEPWDNCGMQIDMGREFVNRILVCLEITKAVVEEAISRDVDLIVTHHPLLFHPIKRIDNHETVGNYLIDLVFTGISVYSSHTSFDRAPGGNNDELAGRLCLKQVEGLCALDAADAPAAMGRMGYLPTPLSLGEVCSLLCEVLGNPEGIKAVGDPEKIIEKVGLCTGAAGEFVELAKSCGCDLYITGDVKHHEAQAAREMGLCLIDAGHFGTEASFAQNMKRQLQLKTAGHVEILESKTSVNPYDFML